MKKRVQIMIIAVLAMSFTMLKAEPSSVEFDEFRETSLDNTKWQLSAALDEPGAVLVNPTFDGENIVFQSSVSGWSLLIVTRDHARIKGMQTKTTCYAGSTNDNATSGCDITFGDFSLWMQINNETINGLEPAQGTIEMVVQNASTSLDDYTRIPYAWGTEVELKVVYHDDGYARFYVDDVMKHQYNIGTGLTASEARLEVGVANNEKAVINEARLLVDLQDVTLSTSTPSVPEGRTQTVTVTFPTNHPCDMPIVITPDPVGDADLTISPATFTLTPRSPTQVLTITAAEDADGINGTRMFDLDPYGTNNHAIITATEVDNELPQILITPDTLTVIEGSTNTAIVSLTTYDVDVPITITSAGTDSDLSISPTSFTLTSSTPTQTVTVTAAEDVDMLAGTETFTASSAGLDDTSLNATELDNDIIRVIATPGATAEGVTNTQAILVQLSKDPGTPVTLNISRTSGDSDLTCTASIILDSTNWNGTNYLAITAAEDNSDTENDSALFTITGADEDATFTAISVDDDILLTVNKTGSGSVTGGGIYDLNDDTFPIPITAVPDLGQSFISWAGPDADKVADTSSELTVIAAVADSTITAQFKSPDDDDDEWYEGGCSIGSTPISLLPLFALLFSMLIARFRKR